jgi:undecaprenyl-diphosphatase
MPSRIRPGAPPQVSLAQALILGALHGPAELWPVSSSGHVTLISWLLGWPYPSLDAELRKSFEVALHAGTACALLADLPGRTPPGEPGQLDRRRVARLVLASAPPAAAGYALRAPISHRLGAPRSVALGLIAGALAMLAADRCPERRSEAAAGPIDALCLGLAQACALIPGVSRSGATLAAARARGFTRRDAAALSSEVGLPVILGAAGLEARGLRRQRLPRAEVAKLAAGAGAALASGLLSARLIGPVTGRGSLRGFAAYRIALGSLVLALRPGSTARPRPAARA